MEVMDIVTVFLRWIHVFGGIIWIGFLFFFGFIFSPAVMQMTPEARGPVYTSIITRTVRWIRPVTGLTYLTGILLLGIVFHMGGVMFETGYGWGAAAGIASLLAFLLFLPYDMIARTSVGMKMGAMGVVMVVGSMAYLYLMTDVAGMTYRSSMIHIGVLYGTILAANVFMRVLPAQRRMLAAMQKGEAPDPNDMTAAQTRAKHNIYLSIPLVWTMLNQHTVVPGASSHLWFLGVLVLSILLVSYLYRPAPQTS